MRDDFDRLEKEAACGGDLGRLLATCEEFLKAVFDAEGREEASTIIQFIVYKNYKALGKWQSEKEGK